MIGLLVMNVTKQASPELFISYQWDKQPQIKALYRKLTHLGYRCWLDVMQMGGGDSLYDKIDRGVRGCQLVLSCTTPKYALSANCRSAVTICVKYLLIINLTATSIGLHCLKLNVSHF